MDRDDLQAENQRLRHERDLYLRLLDLGSEQDLDSFLRHALAMVVEIVGAREAYLELMDDGDGAEPRWAASHGFSVDELHDVRSALSRGIVAHALASGETVYTPSAARDPRFSDRPSVCGGRIEAVVCVPIGPAPPIGVLYLQGRAVPGAFTVDDRMKAETFVRHVTPFIDRLLVRDRAAGDATTSVRRAIHAPGVIGRSEALAAVLRQVALVAPLDVHVLITGESGTGKSQLARVVHDNGPRATGPFVELNCAALPETLIENELFGSLAGAHSTATRRTDGKVAAAEGGTLFLDEITELALAAQAKVLHLLQSRQYFPLGGTKPVMADVRIIAGTNADLERAVREGRLREDLFYRLHVLPVRLPALRERREDIADLVQFFCAAACAKHRLPALAVSRMALHAAENSEWPGNVRQLANFIEAAAIRAAGAGAARIERAHLFPNNGAPIDGVTDLSFQEATRHFQAEFLRDALASADWNVMDVARRLDLARSHLYTLIHAFGLERQVRKR